MNKILLYGPSGGGKTTLAEAIAKFANAESVISTTADQVVKLTGRVDDNGLLHSLKEADLIVVEEISSKDQFAQVHGILVAVDYYLGMKPDLIYTTQNEDLKNILGTTSFHCNYKSA